MTGATFPRCSVYCIWGAVGFALSSLSYWLLRSSALQRCLNRAQFCWSFLQLPPSCRRCRVPRWCYQLWVRRGSVTPDLLRPMKRAVLPAIEELNLRMALLNTRSLVNTTFLVNDFFTSRDLDFMLLTETWLLEGESTPHHFLNFFLPAINSSVPLRAPAEVAVWPLCSNPAFSVVLFHLLHTPALNYKCLSYNSPLSLLCLRLFITLLNLIRTSSVTLQISCRLPLWNMIIFLFLEIFIFMSVVNHDQWSLIF